MLIICQLLTHTIVIHMNSKCNISVLMGAQGIKQAYEMSLTAQSLDIICLSQNYDKILGNYFDKDYAPRLFTTSIHTREIISDNKENRSYAKTKNSVKNEVGFLFKGMKSESDFLVSDQFVFLISFNPLSPYAIVIGDEEMVKSMKSKFEVLWSSALK